jgi:AAA domain
MLAGHPFVGKSMLVAGLLKAMEKGEAFLGQATVPATGLLISEEDKAALRARAGVLGLLDLQSEYVGRSSGVFGLTWPELIEQASDHALKNGHRLLVIDTFPGLAGLEGEQENDAGAIAERLRPLQVAAGRGLAVIFLHHMNGQGQPRGSKAFRGIVDTSIRAYRQHKSRVVRLETESRFPTATPASVKAALVKAPDGWFYEALSPPGIAGEQRSEDTSTDVCLLEALVHAGPNGLTYEEIDQIDGLSKDIAKKRLPQWRQERKVDHYGQGLKTDPYRWYAITDRGFSAVRSAP